MRGLGVMPLRPAPVQQHLGPAGTSPSPKRACTPTSPPWPLVRQELSSGQQAQGGVAAQHPGGRTLQLSRLPAALLAPEPRCEDGQLISAHGGASGP